MLLHSRPLSPQRLLLLLLSTIDAAGASARSFPDPQPTRLLAPAIKPILLLSNGRDFDSVDVVVLCLCLGLITQHADILDIAAPVPEPTPTHDGTTEAPLLNPTYSDCLPVYFQPNAPTKDSVNAAIFLYLN